MASASVLLDINKHAETVSYIAYHLNDTLNLDETGTYVKDLRLECEQYLDSLEREGFKLPKKVLEFDPFEVTEAGRALRREQAHETLRVYMSRLLDLMRKERHIGCLARYADMYLRALQGYLAVCPAQWA